MTTPCIGFGDIKGPLVLARKKGDIVRTMREVKLPENPEGWGLDGEVIATVPSERKHLGAFAFFRQDTAEPFYVRPRYRRGKVYHVGIPHWRGLDIFNLPAVWDEFTRALREEHRVLAEIEKPPVPGGGGNWRRCSSYCLPSWAATMWLKCLSAEPQRLLDCTEQDAREELVQGAGINADGGPWWDYIALEFICATALASFHTMLAAVLKMTVEELLAANEWFWPYRFKVVEEPEEGRRG